MIVTTIVLIVAGFCLGRTFRRHVHHILNDIATKETP